MTTCDFKRLTDVGQKSPDGPPSPDPCPSMTRQRGRATAISAVKAPFCSSATRSIVTEHLLCVRHYCLPLLILGPWQKEKNATKTPALTELAICWGNLSLQALPPTRDKNGRSGQVPSAGLDVGLQATAQLKPVTDTLYLQGAADKK